MNDAFVIASAENNPLFSDVYGLQFNPLTAERITTMKRISSLGADDGHVIVAAADGDVDRLAVVGGDGSLSPIPGLGRPYAFSPEVKDGVAYYEVLGDDDVTSFFSFALRERKKTRLLKSADLSGITPAEGGVLVQGKPGKKAGDDSLVLIRSASGKARTLVFNEADIGFEVGREWIASTINAPDNKFGDKPEALVVLNMETGKVRRFDGFQAVCWTPDGRRLLARRVGDPLASPLVLIDPTKPEAVVDLGTVPGLAIYSGACVRGEPPA